MLCLGEGGEGGRTREAVFDGKMGNGKGKRRDKWGCGRRKIKRPRIMQRAGSLNARPIMYTVLSPETVLLVVKGTGSRDRIQKYLDKNGYFSF
jgi:hypothetical protein